MEGRRPLAGHRVMITFDDGYADFATHAWPLLREHGFGALLFVVAGEVGGANRWGGPDAGEPLLDWPELLRLRADGVEIGAHSVSHPFMTILSPAEVTREAARSRSILTDALGAPPLAFAYPYGDRNPAVRELVGASGYAYAFSTRSHRSRYTDDLLDLPRIEVGERCRLEEFVARLGD
jgi:peptidoglycan/xylan/chitin deacetylase (PgdA/CDA1 family)